MLDILGTVGGLAASLFGANQQAKGAKQQADASARAASEQRDFDTSNALDVMYRQMRALYGDRAAEALRPYISDPEYQALFGSTGTAENPRAAQIRARLAEIDQQIARGTNKRVATNVFGVPAQGGDMLQQERQALQKELASLPAGNTPGRFSTAPTGDSGYIQKFEDLIKSFTGETDGLMKSYDADTGTIVDQGNRNLDALSGFGVARKAAVDRDVRRAGRSSNAAIAASMANSGLSGSSLIAQAISGNAKRLFEAGSDRKSSIDDQIMALLASGRDANLNRLTGRLGARTQLKGGILDRNQNLRQQPLQIEFATMTGPAFAPFANRNTQAYFPGVSGNGLGTAASGAVLSGLGSQMFGAGSKALLERLFKGSGGGFDDGSQMSQMYQSRQ